jgi:hypothetical protein
MSRYLVSKKIPSSPSRKHSSSCVKGRTRLSLPSFRIEEAELIKALPPPNPLMPQTIKCEEDIADLRIGLRYRHLKKEIARRGSGEAEGAKAKLIRPNVVSQDSQRDLTW